jgi:hypothetical protein
MPPEPVSTWSRALKSCGTVTRTLPEPVSMFMSGERWSCWSVTPPEPVVHAHQLRIHATELDRAGARVT